MTMHTRQLLLNSMLAGCIALALPCAAQAQSGYPNKTITMIVPAAAGGTTDIAARMLAEPLGKSLGQTIVVENRGGASGTLATSAVQRAPADGYTLLMQYSGFHVITPWVAKPAPQWDPIKDFAPVANVLTAPQLIVVRSSLPVTSMPELIAYAKANPGKLNYASSGNGSLQHVTGAMLEQLAGIRMNHIPYKGTGAALHDLLGGQVDLTFGTPPPFLSHVESNKLRALGITGKDRLASFAGVPTTSELGLGKLDASSWFAVYAPAGTPPAIVDKLSAEIAKIVRSDSFKQKAVEQGAKASYMTPVQLADHTKAELSRWGEVVKSANIQAAD